MRTLGLGLGLGLGLLAAVALAGCGGGGGEAGSAAAKPPAPEQVQDGASLGMVRAHQTVSLRLYEAGQRGQAVKHAGHPTEELFFGIARTLRSKDAALTADLRKALRKPVDLIYASVPATELEAAFGQAWSMLDLAEASLVPTETLASTGYQAQVVGRLLETAEAEYGEAVQGTQIVKRVEYQDAWAALEEAHRRFHGVRNELDHGAAADVERRFEELETMLPGMEAPRRAAPQESLANAVDAAVAALAVASGVEVVADPVAEIEAVAQLLDEAGRAYAAGDRAGAEETVAEAYLEHFELIEAPLAEQDPRLMERLEVLIATTLRDRIKAKAPVPEVARLVAEAKQNLARAEKLLAAG